MPGGKGAPCGRHQRVSGRARGGDRAAQRLHAPPARPASSRSGGGPPPRPRPGRSTPCRPGTRLRRPRPDRGRGPFASAPRPPPASRHGAHAGPAPPRTGADGSSPAAGHPPGRARRGLPQGRVPARPPAATCRSAHLAAIGQVESGSIGGRSVTAGPPGHARDLRPAARRRAVRGRARQRRRRLRRRRHYDRAMGPLQFLPGTWSWAGRDGDGDGRRDPQNVFDAALGDGRLPVPGRARPRPRPATCGRRCCPTTSPATTTRPCVEWVSYFQRHGLAALTTVAFRVGSGGRASALAAPDAGSQPARRRAPSATAAEARPAEAGSALHRRRGPATPDHALHGPPTATPTPPPTDDPGADPTTPAPSTHAHHARARRPRPPTRRRHPHPPPSPRPRAAARRLPARA